jgi:hypothetical protein
LKSWVCGAAVVANNDDLIDEVDPDATIRPSRRKDHLPHHFDQSDHTKTRITMSTKPAVHRQLNIKSGVAKRQE